MPSFLAFVPVPIFALRMRAGTAAVSSLLLLPLALTVAAAPSPLLHLPRGLETLLFLHQLFVQFPFALFCWCAILPKRLAWQPVRLIWGHWRFGFTAAENVQVLEFVTLQLVLGLHFLVILFNLSFLFLLYGFFMLSIMLSVSVFG